MSIAVSTSTCVRSLEAAAEAIEGVGAALGSPPDLAFLFASHHHAPELEELVEKVATELGARHLAGCAAESVIGGRVEHWGRPGLVLWAARLPGAELASSQISLDQTPDGFALLGLPEIPAEGATLILLGEPYTFPADEFLRRMAEDHPDLQVLGGMASGAVGPGENRLFLGPEVLVDGAVGVLISGSVRVRPLVSQGCRPFGKHLVVTRAERNLIHEIAGRPAVEKLSEQLKELTSAERTLLERGLHIGLAMDARKRQLRRGDFLVRNVMGISKDSGAIVVTDVLKAGMTVQFHLRDSETASEDLQELLREAASGPKPMGGLLFTCNGRGRRLFEVADHDAASIGRELGEVPLAGFFAAGEMGPVGGRNFLHGFTASLALFEDAG